MVCKIWISKVLGLDNLVSPRGTFLHMNYDHFQMVPCMSKSCNLWVFMMVLSQNWNSFPCTFQNTVMAKKYETVLFFLQYWLDVDKQLNHQVGLSNHEPLLKFCVKFYTPDPSMIEEEYTRYLFGLEIKRDLATSQLQCNDNTAALMASYIVQGKPRKLQLFLHPKGYPMGWSKGNKTLSWNHCEKLKKRKF